MPAPPPTCSTATTCSAAISRRRSLAALIALLLAVLGIVSPEARSARGSGEVRVAGTCGTGATSSLRLKAEDGAIRIRFKVESNRRHSRWQAVLVREGRVVWRGRVRSDGGGTLNVTRRILNLRGANQVTARALGPHGITCIAAATLQG
jgi:hypothetical protein